MFNKQCIYHQLRITVRSALDTAPTLDLMAVNSLAAASSVIIPVAPKFLDAKGLNS